MPYRAHFGLTNAPFALTPNRALFFPESLHSVLSALNYAVDRGEGIIKIVGEVGTGKTLLCRLLLQSLNARAATAFITAPRNDAEAIERMVAREFGIRLKKDDDVQQKLLKKFLEFNEKGRPAILLIDEAQALDRTGLEAVRLLSNFENDEKKLLQIVLFGQPELDTILAQYDLRQFAQRISFNFTTHAMTPQVAVRYIQHRIDCCTDQPTPHQIMQPRAKKLIAVKSRGIPRIIHVLADRALMAAFAEGEKQVRPRHVKAGLEEGIVWPDRPPLLWRLFGGRAA